MQSHGGVAPVGESLRWLAAGSVLSDRPAASRRAARGASDRPRRPRHVRHGRHQHRHRAAAGRRADADGREDRRLLAARGAAVARHPSRWAPAVARSPGSTPAAFCTSARSAGADPGPACYGKGGTLPTVTDANLVRGLLDPANFLGGRIRLDVEAARRAVATIARALDTELLPAAEGVARVVNTNMAEGIKLVSVRRGVDPRGFTLVAFGGAAGLHVTEVARLLEIRRVIVPSVAAVLSAWGMLATDLRYELVRSHVSEVGRLTAPRLRRLFAGLEAQGRRRLRGFEGAVRFAARSTCATASRSSRSACRSTAWTSRGPTCWTRWLERFHRRHEELYAYSARARRS